MSSDPSSATYQPCDPAHVALKLVFHMYNVGIIVLYMISVGGDMYVCMYVKKCGKVLSTVPGM